MTKEHIYFLGIGGTLMGSLALLAKAMGYRVSGSDKALYPPMSDQLAQADIDVFTGFDPTQLDPAPSLVVIGNAGLPRGHEAVEYILDSAIPYTSGAQWLGDTLLQQRWVLAVAGTHGKTTTASMLAWILEYAGLNPGYLIGGVPLNFERSSRLGDTPFFVVEADEYDTSYFDRRSKFVHYRPRTLILNNLEYDHADIFPDLGAIQTQFHNLIRTVPRSGLIVAPTDDDNLDAVLAMGCWSTVARVGPPPRRTKPAVGAKERWHVDNQTSDGTAFDVCLNDHCLGRVEWQLLGKHNQVNALNAIAAARHAGVAAEQSIAALGEFRGVKRRMEQIFHDDYLIVYDDFAHHPTAIRSTLEGLRKAVGHDEIIAIIEPRTHTMSLGTLRDDLTTCCAAADKVIWFRGDNIKWDLGEVQKACVVPAEIVDKHSLLVTKIVELRAHNQNARQKRSHAVIMSNGAFGGIYETLKTQLSK